MNNELNTQALPVVSIRLDTDYTLISSLSIRTVKEAIDFISTKMFDLAEERAFALFFDASLSPICMASVGQGTQNNVMFSARDIVQTALLCDATYVTIIHNHPGYNVTKGHTGPSRDDILVTNTIVKACSLVDVMVYDSIIISGYKERTFGKMEPIYYSLRSHNFNRVKRKLKIKDVEKLPKDEQDLNWEPIKKDRTDGENIPDPAIKSEGIEYVIPQAYEQELRNQKLSELDFKEDVEVFG